MDNKFYDELQSVNRETFSIKGIEEENIDTRIREKLYEVEFEALDTKEIEKFESKTALLDMNLDVSVTIGSCKKSIKDILNLKSGDILYLNKTIDEDLDVTINNKNIATGESVKVDDKVSVRILEFKKN